jgi:uncharacterized protein (TIGR02270 family)
MITSHRACLMRLYEEYLQEASFLYEQRLTLFRNPEITWRKIGEFEERLEAHIDGLVVGDKLAIDVCKRPVTEGDFGELFAAVCVFCRQEQRDLVLAIFEQLDPDDVEKATAVADALKYELPDAWIRDFLTLLEVGDPKLAPILARAFGYRRVLCGPQLLTSMKRCPASALPEMVWALGRIGYEPAGGTLLDLLKSEEEPVRAAAALSLARMGERRALEYCGEQAFSSHWPVLPLGLAGDRRSLSLLTQMAERNAGGDCLTALGLLGDPTSVPLFISRLEQPEAAPSAAIALHCITGAGIYETVFIPDEVDEDELFDSEREQLKQGKPLDRGDGRPFGSSVTRLSQNPQDWKGWWQANSGRFTPGVRFRNGVPFSPAALVEMLAAEKTPHELRRFCSEEIATRYRYDFGFETDMPAARQSVLLSQTAAWSESCPGRFRDGGWYFAGTLLGS